jgi:hypothetical protein
MTIYSKNSLQEFPVTIGKITKIHYLLGVKTRTQHVSKIIYLVMKTSTVT